MGVEAEVVAEALIKVIQATILADIVENHRITPIRKRHKNYLEVFSKNYIYNSKILMRYSSLCSYYLRFPSCYAVCL